MRELRKNHEYACPKWCFTNNNMSAVYQSVGLCLSTAKNVQRLSLEYSWDKLLDEVFSKTFESWNLK